MINHARTLLLNRGPDGFGFDFPGEEYVPDDFKPRQLTPSLRFVHQSLFGTSPDRLFLNYRLRRIMSLLHSTELGEFVTRFDSRITYLPLNRTDMFDTLFNPVVTSITGWAGATYLSGQSTANDGLGKAQFEWKLTVTAADTLQIVTQTSPITTTEAAYTAENMLSSRIALPGTDITFRFQDAPVGTTWIITANARPVTPFSDVMSQLVSSFGDAGVSNIFPPLPIEPMKTFYAIWRKHQLAAYRYSALLLAVIERINEQPQELPS